MATGDQLFHLPTREVSDWSCSKLIHSPHNVLSFLNGVDQYARWVRTMPTELYAGGDVDLHFAVSYPSNPGGAGNFYYRAGIYVVSGESDVTATPSFSYSVYQHHPGNNSDLQQFQLTITITGSALDSVSAGDRMIVEFQRNGTSGNDNASVLAEFLGGVAVEA